jgi:hypothetical protein
VKTCFTLPNLQTMRRVSNQGSVGLVASASSKHRHSFRGALGVLDFSFFLQPWFSRVVSYRL